MPNFLIETPVTEFQTLLLGETGVITASGSVTATGGNAVLLNLTGAGGTITLDNYGSITSPTAEAIALVGTSSAPAHVQIYNRAGAMIGNYLSAFTIGANFGGGTLRIDNAGTINGAIYTNLETDFITNTGTINGLISTDAGIDTITSSGTVNGGINAGSGNDVITLSGLAVVTGVIDGGTGIDRLTADYSAAAYHPDFIDRVITSSGGSFAGNFYSNNAQSAAWLRFQSIEQLALTFGSEADQVVVNLAALANGATISLDGGTGFNRLTADFSTLGNTSFVVAANGTIAANQGSYARFQGFDLTLGGGINTITTGAQSDSIKAGAGTHFLNTGDDRDQITTVGGTVVLDAGAFSDLWTADFRSSTVGIATTISGTTVTMSNGSSASNLESLVLMTGSGDDSMTVSGGNVAFYAGAGFDSLTSDFSGRPTAPISGVHTFSWEGSGFNGGVHYGTAYEAYESIEFAGIENLNFKLADGDDAVQINLRWPFAGLWSLVLDGGLGANSLSLKQDAFAGGGLTFSMAAGGAITSNLGSLAQFQSFAFVLEGSNNLVTTGAANDSFVTYGGAQTLDGGGGDDSWTGYHQTSAATTFSISGNTATFASSTGTTALANIESQTVTLGSQSDNGTVTQAGAIRTDIDAGSGNDSLTIDYSARSNDGQFDYSQIAFGEQGFLGYAIHNGQISSAFNSGDINALYFRSFERLTVIFGGDDDLVTIYGAASRAGSVLSVDGGAGRDTLDIPLSFYQFSITPGANGGFVVTDLDLSNGNYGTMTVFNTEVLSFSNAIIELLDGTANDDTLNGTAETDIISGGAGSDQLSGGAGNDTLYGGSGADFLIGGADADIMIGEGGDDTYVVDDPADQVIEALDGGFDAVSTNIDYVLGENVEALKLTGLADLTGTGNTLNNVMRGNGGANLLFGGLGDDKLRGGGGSDTLLGEGGADRLFGGDGQDYLSGGEGADFLTGGAGIDHFIFDSYDWDTNVDSILDFTTGSDRIELDRSLFDAFSGLSAGGISASMFKLGTAATNGNHRLIYDAATGSLFYDPDGVGGAAQSLLAMLTPGTTLHSGDLHLI
jgi:Ca2+-binding RTX toxin-like protein